MSLFSIYTHPARPVWSSKEALLIEWSLR